MSAPELDEIREALNSGNASLRILHTFTHGMGVQVYIKSRKVGPILLPPEGGTVADTLTTIGSLLTEAGS